MPKTLYPKEVRKGGLISNYKNVTFIDMEMNAKRYVPSPDKYSKIFNWKMSKQGKFSQKKRITMASEILASKHKTPGPGQY